MTKDRSPELLLQSLAELAQARQHLDFSFGQIAEWPEVMRNATPDQLANAEAFTSRFARAVDLLVNKVLRSMGRVELEPEGTVLDLINRAEKRGFVEQALILREMKEVRNMIAHDYAGTRMAEILDYCRAQKPIFDAICNRVTIYAGRLLGEQTSRRAGQGSG